MLILINNDEDAENSKTDIWDTYVGRVISIVAP